MPFVKVKQSDRDRLARWKYEPVQFVRECFGAEPDAWQLDALNLLPTRGGIARICLKACAGPGKTAVLAWAGWWFMSLNGTKIDHPKGIALAITGDNLRTNLWPEMAKWQQRSPWLTAAFTHQAEQIFANDSPKDWFLKARSFAQKADAQTQGNTLSGVHSRYVFYLLDETGDMLPAVGRAAEQGLAGTDVGLAIQAGNPTSLSGLLAESSRTWDTITITADPDDPKRTPRVPVEWAREQIAKEPGGRENPWVMSYILGKFPPGGINQLLGQEDVQTAQNRSYMESDFNWAPKTIGVDVARAEGSGADSSVIIRRQGNMCWEPVSFKGIKSHELGDRVAYEINEWHPDAVFVDGTGGYGGGVIDRLHTLGHQRIIDVQFASSATSPRYLNKRMEMWWEMAQWVKMYGQLPKNTQLADDLVTPKYSFQEGSGKMVLESKEQIKKRGKPSPDFADALAVTFHSKIIPQQLVDAVAESQEQARPRHRFNPLGILDRMRR